MEKLRDKAEAVADHVADCKLELIGAKFHDEAEARNYKDTHVDLSMEMWILHNRSRDDVSGMWNVHLILYSAIHPICQYVL